MYLVALLLPLFDNAGAPQPRGLFQQVATELTGRFGGLTAYTRAPAEGLWTPPDGQRRATRDEVVVYEVMVSSLERAWWTAYRRTLEERFGQEHVIVRAHGIELL